MMKLWTKYLCGLLAAAPFAVQAQVDLTKLDRDMAGPRSQVLVLGTVHLKNMPASFNTTALDSLLDKLAAFKPEIITVEEQSGEECDLIARHPTILGSPYNCISTALAKEATGLDIPAALAEINKTFKTWPSHPSAAQRRRLITLFLAASDGTSACVQWLQLSEDERHTGDGLNLALLEQIEKLAADKGEQLQIAAKLAARLGLQRIYAIDNHTGDNLQIADGKVKSFSQALTDAWKGGSAKLNEEEKQTAVLKHAHELLPLYRHINSQNFQRITADAEVRSPMRSTSPESFPQMWVAGWEIRNLRIVANIRETFRERPGARVLSIVGSSHKPWFDSWLGQLQGVDIVDAVRVLQ